MAGLGPELSPKRLELLTQAIPEVTRVAVLRGLAPQTLELQAMEVGARALGVQLQLLEARNPTEIDEIRRMRMFSGRAIDILGPLQLTTMPSRRAASILQAYEARH